MSLDLLALFLTPHERPHLGLLSKKGEMGLFIKAAPLSPCHLHQRSILIF